MKIKPVMTACCALFLATTALPASAQRTVIRRSGVIGPDHGAAVNRTVVQTDGQGNATYNRTGAAVGPEGNSALWQTEGHASYDPELGYSGEATTTVNGETYHRVTTGGSTTVTNPAGESSTYTRFRFR
ncbi:MAG: hypothetical protein HC800_20420 [Phormidesmis sp. RL_2_1]|nr:hypothetical protein [Phormidesmis sp. RL_2_1]